ncbi:hypothetical protein AB0M79_14875 [Polymorphospora sp. NPDC051019]|uniref:hypothetical protein n=1 Tax=Polymorphospora sp. NPDC051019 TaxID=3155725 RepID=UPI00342157AD
MSIPPMAPATRRRPPYAIFAVGWEAVLLLVTVIAVGVIALQVPLLRGGNYWYGVATLGLLASGFALSLRTATPNLAVVGQATLAGVVYAKLVADSGWAAVPAGLVAVLVLLVSGAFLGLVAGLTTAPGWAVSLGGLIFVQAIALAMIDGRSLAIPTSGRPGTGTTILWAVLFLVISIGGGLLWLVPKVRTLLAANRFPGDPVPGWRLTRLLGAVVGFTGSSVLAALAGIVAANQLRVVSGLVDLSQLALVVGAVLLGGVSVFGRRGGVAGTALAVVLLVAINFYLTLEGAPRWIAYGVVPALAVLGGIGIGRGLEALAGPESDEPSAPTPPGYAPASAAYSPTPANYVPPQAAGSFGPNP